MRDIVARARFPRRTTTCRPSSACRSRCCRPTPAARWRPTRSADNIWDNFSSQSYKELPSVGTITWYDPYTGEPRTYTMPAGGRGYTRPPSLVSLWSTAPFLLNNTVGPFRGQPVGRGAAAIVRRFDRADAVAREARQGLAARRQDSRRDRSRRRSAAAGPREREASI